MPGVRFSNCERFFLQGQFKSAQRQVIPDEELRAGLADYQGSVREGYPTALPESASHYLNDWTRRQFVILASAAIAMLSPGKPEVERIGSKI